MFILRLPAANQQKQAGLILGVAPVAAFAGDRKRKRPVQIV
jgi:hypothetical protein